MCVASCRRDWPWLDRLRPHCSSWQDRSWELFNSRRIGGSASHRHPMSTRTHTQTHTCTCAYHATAQPGQLCVSASDKTSLLPESTLHSHERCDGPQSLPNTQSSVRQERPTGKLYELNCKSWLWGCKNDHICIANATFASLASKKKRLGKSAIVQAHIRTCLSPHVSLELFYVTTGPKISVQTSYLFVMLSTSTFPLLFPHSRPPTAPPSPPAAQYGNSHV